MSEVDKRLKRIKWLADRYGVASPELATTIPPKPKPKPKKKKKQKITLPSGVRTPMQLKEFREIMGIE